MAKNHYATLRKLVRKNRYKDFEGRVENFNQLIVLKNPERIIWTNGESLIVDDPTLINSIGGKYIVGKCLKKEPTAYNLQVRDNSLQIAGKFSAEYIHQIKDILSESKSNLYSITVQEFEDLRLRTIPISKDFREYVSYVQKTFSDKKLETFVNKEKGPCFYFFDNEKIKAILV